MRAKKSVKNYVTIRERKRKNCISFYLRYVLPNGKRVEENTGFFITDATTPLEREKNKEVRKAVEKLRSDKTIELINNKGGIETATKSQKKLLLTDYIEIKNEASQRAPKTKRGYTNLKLHIEEFTPDVKVVEVDKDWVVDFLDSLSDLKASSKRLYCTLLSAVLRLAVKENIIASNPVEKLGSDEKPKVKQTKREYLTPEELEQVAAAFPQTTKYQKEGLRMFLFSCYTGLRFSDIAKIKWQDLKKDRSSGKYYFNIEMQKTKEVVKGYLSRKALELIGKPAAANENIFWGSAYLANADKCLKIAADAAGINKNISFHTARHTFAVNLLAGGMDIYSVSRLLGHTDIKTTQIYLEMMPKKQIEAADLIDSIF